MAATNRSVSFIVASSRQFTASARFASYPRNRHLLLNKPAPPRAFPACLNFVPGFWLKRGFSRTLKAMEVHFAPELQARIDQLVIETGYAPDKLLEDAMAGYIAE